MRVLSWRLWITSKRACGWSVSSEQNSDSRRSLLGVSSCDWVGLALRSNVEGVGSVMVLLVDAQRSKLRLASVLRLPPSQVVAVRSLNRALAIAADDNPAGIVVAARSVGYKLGNALKALHAVAPLATLVVVHEDEGSPYDADLCLNAGALAYVAHTDRDRVRTLLKRRAFFVARIAFSVLARRQGMRHAERMIVP
jgi:hypothetical protein